MTSDISERLKLSIQAIHSTFNRTDKLSHITNLHPVETTDGKFTKVGVAFRIERLLFEPSEPPLVGLEEYGSVVANAEIDYLLNNFLSAKSEIWDLSPSVFSQSVSAVFSHAQEKDSVSIIMPYEIGYDLIDKNYGIRWDNETNGFVYMNNGTKIRIYHMRDETLRNKFLIIDKNAIKTEFKKQISPIGNGVSRLDVEVKEIGALQLRFEIKTVLKFHLQNANGIKILEIPAK